MDFESHLTIISHNLEKEGYDSFFPSICVPGDDLSFDVLAVDLGSHGEEIVAKEWASVVGSEHYFLAYRAGNRMVHVCEVIDHKVVRKQVIEVQPSGAMT